MDKTTKKTLIAVSFPAMVALLVGFSQFVLPLIITKPKSTSESANTSTFVGRVTNEATGKVIEAAKVSLEARGLPPVIYTDSEGRFSFALAADVHEIRIRVDAQGYRPFERRINVSAKTEHEDIRLAPLESSPKPLSTVTQPRSKKTRRGLSLEEQKNRAREILTSKHSSPLL